MNSNFTYSTGRPLTAPLSQYRLGEQIIPNFSERNQYRIPDYSGSLFPLSLRPIVQ
ncbi:MAG: hypothetical protein HC880_04205 [Bacteroidia bacterium]|nr:hypothetical protein [Bacteroidia bacterium]